MNRLIGNGGSFTFAYGGDGNRVQKNFNTVTNGDVTTYYIVDDRNPSGYAQVVEEFTFNDIQDSPPKGVVSLHLYMTGLEDVSGMSAPIL